MGIGNSQTSQFSKPSQKMAVRFNGTACKWSMWQPYEDNFSWYFLSNIFSGKYTSLRYADSLNWHIYVTSEKYWLTFISTPRTIHGLGFRSSDAQTLCFFLAHYTEDTTGSAANLLRKKSADYRARQHNFDFFMFDISSICVVYSPVRTPFGRKWWRGFEPF